MWGPEGEQKVVVVVVVAGTREPGRVRTEAEVGSRDLQTLADVTCLRKRSIAGGGELERQFRL